ncbi:MULTISPECIES: TorD/DmsD family molecular chaperone [unclassified Adlercreutzia]|uniref:TorD/DmsD family molecular chaperone n=1 Tax=unclassified Adlercreutzia TaxID=2636013 RepID=UPI0013EDCCB6|nr:MULTISPECIES: molecular chaperone TorD family protein [unclassified Adlercreutzia]
MADEANIEEKQKTPVAEDQVDFAQDETTAQMIEALEGRAAFYDLLASIYFRPLTQEQIENIAAMDLSVYADVNEQFADGLNDITRYLRKRNTGTRQELAVDFTTSFGGAASWKGMYATPYESCFTSEEGFMFQESYHEVYQLFKQNGVGRAEGYDYPDDHLSFMFEFLVIMSNRTVTALREGDRATALENVKISQDFLQAHVLSWFDLLVERATLLQKTRFYRGILKISKGFFLFDADVLDELRAELEEN